MTRRRRSARFEHRVVVRLKMMLNPQDILTKVVWIFFAFRLLHWVGVALVSPTLSFLRLCGGLGTYGTLVWLVWTIADGADIVDQ